MLKGQMEKIEQMVGEQGLKPERQRIAEARAENERSDREFDRKILAELEKSRKNQSPEG